MTTFTVVPDSVLEPGDPIRSVDIIAIKENTNYNHENTVLELLETQTLTSTGTWTKATGYDPTDTVMMFLIGGGGSGYAARHGSNNLAGSGGVGGTCQILYGNYSSFPSSLYAIIGAGGAARTRTTNGATDGNNGSSSILRADSLGATDIISALGGNAGSGVSPATGTISVNTDNSSFTAFVFTSLNRAGSEIHRTTADGFSVGGTSNSNTVDSRLLRTAACAFTSGGGGVAREGATNRDVYNAAVPGYLNTGGAGSGTADGENGSLGSGGGACARFDANATSGAGGDGALIVQYFRGSIGLSQLIRG